MRSQNRARLQLPAASVRFRTRIIDALIRDDVRSFWYLDEDTCAAACPILFAPAMNDRMWANPITQENVARLKKCGYEFVGPEAGWLACRNVGPGRLSEPSQILQKIVSLLGRSARSSRSKK